MPVATGRQQHVLPAPFTVESGAVLPRVTVAYQTWGTLAPTRDNAVLVCHALTGSADVADWWGALIGPEGALDPAHRFHHLQQRARQLLRHDRAGHAGMGCGLRRRSRRRPP